MKLFVIDDPIAETINYEEFKKWLTQYCNSPSTERSSNMSTSEAPWPFEQADSLRHHISTLADRLEDEIVDEDQPSALSTVTTLLAKARELQRELIAIPVPVDMSEPEEEVDG